MVLVLNLDSSKYNYHRTWFQSEILIHKNIACTKRSSTDFLNVKNWVYYVDIFVCSASLYYNILYSTADCQTSQKKVSSEVAGV